MMSGSIKHRWITAMAVALALVAGGVAHAQDSTAGRRTAIAGSVRDSLGHPVRGVSIAVEGTNVATATDDSGHFHLTGMPAGPTRFTMMKIGYKPIAFEVNMPGDTTVLVDVRLHVIPTLTQVDVRGESVSPKLAHAGFYDRKRQGFGTYITPERIDSMNVSTPSQLLRDVRGVQVRCRQAGRCAVTQSFGGCLQLLVDGVVARGQLDDFIGSAGEIYAIEVYERPLLVPMDLQKGSAGRGCGAIAVWTKAYSP